MEYWRKSEWRLGLFIACGIVMFSVLVFTISNLNFFQRSYEVRVLFKFANGIESGAPARLAGVKVGEVKNVKIIYNPDNEAPLVEVDLLIEEDVLIRQNASVLISTLGLLGEKYVEILPGDKGRDLIRDGDIIVGYDTVPMARLSDLAYQIAQKLDQTIDSVREIFLKEENKQDLEDIIVNMKALSYNLNKLAIETNEVMSKINNGEGTFGKILSEDVLYYEILEIVRDIKRNPWKLLRKTKNSEDTSLDDGNQGYLR
ncbi:MAG: MlaD family protein [Candidatus Kaelpia aquatica]|nr:MlaD family protein [Candidatus Kaelpia aquatica]